MPIINGKYVSPAAASEQLTPIDRRKTILENTGKASSNIFTNELRTFQGDWNKYSGYINDPNRTPLNSDFDQIRAENQGIGEKWANSAGKFVWNAGSTVVDGTIGTLAGAINWLANGEGGFTQNPVSKALDEMSASINENLQNYQTRHYQNNPLLGNMFSAEGFGNFWGDSVFANAGYAVGAMASGGIYGAALSGLGRITGISKFGTNLLKNNLSKIAPGMSGGESVSAATQALINSLETGELGKLTKNFVVAELAATSEARMEAAEAVRSFQETHAEELAAMTPRARQEVLDNIAYFVGWTNMGIVTLGNMFAFKHVLGGPSKKAINKFNIIKNKEGIYKAAGSVGTDIGKAVVETVIPEMLEEGSQFAVSKAADEYARLSANKLISDQSQDPEANNTFNDFMASLAFGVGETIGTKEGRTNMMVGALLGGAMPTVVKNDQGKYRPTLNIIEEYEGLKKERTKADKAASDANTAKKFIEAKYASFGESIKELRGLMNPEDGNLDHAKIKEKRDFIVAQLAMMEQETAAIEANDLYTAKTLRDNQLGAMAISMIQAGQLEDLKDLFRENLELTAQEISDANSENINSNGAPIENVRLDRAKSPEEIIKEHKANINKNLEHLDKIAELYNRAQELFQGEVSDAIVNDMVGLMFNHDRHISRIDSLTKSLSPLSNSVLTEDIEGFKATTKERIKDKANVADIDPIVDNLLDKFEKIIENSDTTVPKEERKKSIMELIDETVETVFKPSKIKDEKKAQEQKEKEIAAVAKSLANAFTKQLVKKAGELEVGKSAKELQRDIADLIQLKISAKRLGYAIQTGIANPKQLTKESVDSIEAKNSNAKDYITARLAGGSSLMQYVQETEYLLVALEEAFETQKLFTPDNYDMSDEELELLNNDSDQQTPFWGSWESFLKTQGSQDTRHDIPGNPDVTWYKFLYTKMKRSGLIYKVYSFDNMPEDLEAKFWTGEGYKTKKELVAMPKSELEVILDTLREQLVVVVHDENQNPLKLSNEIVQQFLPEPFLHYASQDSGGLKLNDEPGRNGDIRFSVKKLTQQLTVTNLNLDDSLSVQEAFEMAQQEVVELLKKAREDYKAQRNQWLSSATPIEVFYSHKNPGAVVEGAEETSLKDSELLYSAGIDLSLTKDLDNLEIFTVTSKDNVVSTYVLPNGEVFEGTPGTSYAIIDGFPVVLSRNTLSEEEVENIIFMLSKIPSYSQTERGKLNVRDIVNYLKGTIRMFANQNSKFSIFLDNETNPQYIVFNTEEGIQKIALTDVMANKDILVDFLSNLKYNFSIKSNSNSSFVIVSTNQGQLKFTPSTYKAHMFGGSKPKFTILGKARNKAVKEEAREADMDNIIDNSGRVNPTIAFSPVPVQRAVPITPSQPVVEEIPAEGPLFEIELDLTGKDLPPTIKSLIESKIKEYKAQAERISDEETFLENRILGLYANLNDTVNQTGVTVAAIESQIKELEKLIKSSSALKTKAGQQTKAKIEELKQQIKAQLEVPNQLLTSIKTLELEVKRLQTIKEDLFKQIKYYNNLKAEGKVSKDALTKELGKIDAKIKTVDKLIDKLKKLIAKGLHYIKGFVESFRSISKKLDDFVKESGFNELTLENSYGALSEQYKQIQSEVVNAIEDVEMLEKARSTDIKKLEELTSVLNSLLDNKRYIQELLDEGIVEQADPIVPPVKPNPVTPEAPPIVSDPPVKKKTAKKAPKEIEGEIIAHTFTPDPDEIPSTGIPDSMFNPSEDFEGPSAEDMADVMSSFKADQKKNKGKAGSKKTAKTEPQSSELLTNWDTITEGDTVFYKGEQYIVTKKSTSSKGTKSFSLVNAEGEVKTNISPNSIVVDESKVVKKVSQSDFEIDSSDFGIADVSDQSSQINTDNTTTNDEDIDPDDFLGFGSNEAPFKIVNTSNKSISVDELNWLARLSSLIEVEAVNGLVDGVGVARVISGSKILLSNLANAGTLFHEGFHLYTLTYQKEAKAAYDELRNRLGNKIVRVQSGTEFIEKKGKDLTDREADEFLAYDFEMYMLDPENYQFPKATTAKKNLFTRILDTLKRVLNQIGFNFEIKDGPIPNDILEQFFNTVKTAENIPVTDKVVANDIYSIKDKNGNPIDPNENKMILQYMTDVFVAYIKSPNNITKGFGQTIDASTIFRANQLELEYVKAMKEYFAAATSKDPTTTKILNYLKNKEGSNRAFEAFGPHLKTFKVGVLSDIADEVIEDSKFDLMESNDIGSQKPATEVDQASKVPDSIRFLLLTLPSGNRQYSDPAKLVKVLMNNLTDTETLSEKIAVIDGLVSRYPELAGIKNVLGTTTGNPTKDQVKLQLEFDSFFNLHKNEPIVMVTDKERVNLVNSSDEAVFSSFRSTIKQNVVDRGTILIAEEKSKTSQGKSITSQFSKPFLKKIKDKIDTSQGVQEFLTLLGFDVADVSVIESVVAKNPKFFTEVNYLRNNIVTSVDPDALNMFTNSGMVSIIRQLLPYQNTVAEHMFINPDGKPEYLITLNTYLNNMSKKINKYLVASKIKAENAFNLLPEFLRPYSAVANPMGNPYAASSLVLKEGSGYTISVKEFKGESAGQDSNTVDNQSPLDYFRTTFHATFTAGVPYNRSADRSVEKLVTITTSEGKPFVANYRIAENQFKEYLKGELLAYFGMQKLGYGKGIKFGKESDQYSSGLHLFAQFNPALKKYNTKGKGSIEIMADDFISSLGEELDNYIYSVLSNEQNKTVQYILSNKLAGVNKTAVDGEMYYSTSGLDNNLIVNLYGKEAVKSLKYKDVKNVKGTVKEVIRSGKFVSKTILNQMAMDYVATQMINRIEQTILFTGNPGTFKNAADYNKRTTLLAATRQNSVSGEMNSKLDKTFKRIDGKTREANVIKQIILKDINHPSTNKDLKGVNPTFGQASQVADISDAESWATPDFYRDLMLKSDPANWTEKVEVSWQHQAQLFYLYAIPRSNGKLTIESFKKAFEEHLPADFDGSKIDFKAIRATQTYYLGKPIDRVTLVPLNKQKPQGFGPAKMLGSKFNQGFLPMMDSYKSSVSMATIEVLEDDSPILLATIDAFIDQVDLIRFGTTNKTSGSPEFEAITTELKDGKYQYGYKKLDSNYYSELGWDYVGIQQQTEQKYKESTIYSTQIRNALLANFGDVFESTELLDKYSDLTNLRINKLTRELVKKFDLATNKQAFVDSLVEALGDRATNNAREAIRLTFNGNGFLDSTILKETLENTLFGQFRKEVIHKKVKGTSYVQTSVAGTGLDLQSYTLNTETGKVNASDCAVQCPPKLYKFILKKFGSLEAFNKVIDTQDIISKDLLTFYGNRIPCQGPNLVELVKVKKFLPPYSGAVIIMPAEHTTKTGSDFDVDKLICYLDNYYETADGKLEPLKLYVDKSEEAYQQWKASQKFNLQNTAEQVEEVKELIADKKLVLAEADNLILINRQDLFNYYERVLNRLMSTNHPDFNSLFGGIFEGKQSVWNKIQKINDYLGSNYSTNPKTLNNTTVKKFLPDFKEKEQERIQLLNDLKTISLIENNIKSILENKVEENEQILSEINGRLSATEEEIYRNIFNGLSLDELNTIDVIDNEINYTAKEILQSKEFFPLLVATTDGDVKIIKDVINKYVKLPSPSMMSLVTPSFNNKLTETMFKAGAGIGIIANQASNTVMTSIRPVRIASPYVYNFFAKTNKFGGVLGGEVKSDDGNYIAQAQSGIMSGYVDAAKDAYILAANLEGDMTGALNFITRLSNDGYLPVNTEVVLKLFTMPIISKYLEARSKNQSTYYKQADLKERNLFDLITGEERELNFDFSDQSTTSITRNQKILANFFKKEITIDFIDKASVKEQAKLLDMVLYYEELGQYLTEFEAISRPDRGMEKNRTGLKYNKALEEKVFRDNIFVLEDMRAMMDETFIKSFADTKKAAMEAFKPLFLSEQGVISTYMFDVIKRLLMQKLGKSTIENVIDVQERAFTGYILHHFGKFNKEYSRLLVGPRTNVYSRLQALKAAEPVFTNSQIGKILIGSDFVKDKEGKIHTVAHLKTFSKKYDAVVVDELSNSMLSVHNWLNNKKDPELILDIIKTHIINYGLDYTPNSFGAIIPSKLYSQITSDLINQYISDYANNSDKSREFFESFYQFMVRNKYYHKGIVKATDRVNYFDASKNTALSGIKGNYVTANSREKETPYLYVTQGNNIEGITRGLFINTGRVNEYKGNYFPIFVEIPTLGVPGYFLENSPGNSILSTDNTGGNISFLNKSLITQRMTGQSISAEPIIEVEEETGNLDTTTNATNTTKEFTPEEITSLKPNEIFVFGSNTEGRHGKGAALTAKKKFGAIQSQSVGLQGQSYAVITKDLSKGERSISLEQIGKGLQDLMLFAKNNTDKKFFVTKLGSSLAGYSVDEIKSLFEKLKNIIPDNVILPKEYEVRDTTSTTTASENNTASSNLTDEQIISSQEYKDLIAEGYNPETALHKIKNNC